MRTKRQWKGGNFGSTWCLIYVDCLPALRWPVTDASLPYTYSHFPRIAISAALLHAGSLGAAMGENRHEEQLRLLKPNHFVQSGLDVGER